MAIKCVIFTKKNDLLIVYMNKIFNQKSIVENLNYNENIERTSQKMIFCFNLGFHTTALSPKWTDDEPKTEACLPYHSKNNKIKNENYLKHHVDI